MDAGPGAFVRLGESQLSLADVDIVLLTHLHADHAGELPGLFEARAVSSLPPSAATSASDVFVAGSDGVNRSTLRFTFVEPCASDAARIAPPPLDSCQKKMRRTRSDSLYCHTSERLDRT